MRHRFLILPLIIILFISLCGCQTASTTPAVNKLNGTIYCTPLLGGIKEGEAYEASIQAIIDAQNNLTDLCIDFPEDHYEIFYHDGKPVEVVDQDLNLPYYCAIVYFAHPTTDGVTPMAIAIDPVKGYVMFKPNGNTLECTVASTEPNVDPFEILEYFSVFYENHSR